MRLWRSQRSSWASSKTFAIVIISRAPGAAATKYWNAEERASRRTGGAAAELLGEPLLERQVGVDRDRPQVLGQLDLDLALDPLALERARDALLRGDLADDRALPGRRGGEPERGGDGRLADAALAGDVEKCLSSSPGAIVWGQG